jgi:MscS family membrane protein
MDLSLVKRSLQSISPTDYPWMWKVFIIVLATLVASYVLKFFLAKLKLKLSQTKSLWDDAMLEAAYTPAYYMVWLMGFSWVVDVLETESDAQVFELLLPAREFIFIALLTWYLVRVIRQVEIRMTSNEYSADPVDETTVLALGKLLRTALVITASLIVLQNMGYSISGLLAFGGIGGIAVGFAAKDLLANFFGGLMVYLNRPFAVGDWIRSPDQQIEGVVEMIGWRQTVIRTFDKRPLYVPNSVFSHISVENPSRMHNRRIYETIGLRYCDASKMQGIIADVKAMLQAHEEIDSEQTLIVNFTTFGPSSLDFFVYTFTRTTNWVQFHEIKQDVLLKILAIVHEHGGDVAFPTTTLDLPEPVLIGEASS